ncbi:MAG: 3-phosphoshikimate 1-carboxyvinyltransferase [Candidatus Glassbacteria bacterium]|nr:3-phosphoshikimate 1-carboxyvinyltransferase [Candidatus Glassbacteria bacterium]
MTCETNPRRLAAKQFIALPEYQVNQRITTAAKFSGTVRVPGDKSISHRALMFAAMAEGESTLTGLATGRDVASTASCLRALGAEIDELTPGAVTVAGVRAGRFAKPAGELDAGNSGTTIRLLSGILAGQRFGSVITGDNYLRRRPMKRVIDPLELMGARFESDDGRPPLAITGGALRGIEYQLPVPSAQVKSCVLLAGLFAAGTTSVLERVASRDHSERMLPVFGVDVSRDGLRTSVGGGSELRPADLTIPGDPSSAAFFAAAAALVPGGKVLLENICLNPTRAAFFDVIESMGAAVERLNQRSECGEPVADVRVGHGELTSFQVGGELIPSLIDEIPVLAVLAANARGVSQIRDAGELRVKETDRLKAVAANLAAMGAKVEEQPDGLVIEGPSDLRGCTLESFGDHRIAMSFSVAGLVASGDTVIEDPACADISYPGFYRELETLAGK